MVLDWALFPGLLVMLAEHNQGKIDWSCCMADIFTRVQKMFSLSTAKKGASWKIMDWKVSGKIAASLSRCVTKIRPEKGLAKLMLMFLGEGVKDEELIYSTSPAFRKIPTRISHQHIKVFMRASWCWQPITILKWGSKAKTFSPGGLNISHIDTTSLCPGCSS